MMAATLLSSCGWINQTTVEATDIKFCPVRNLINDDGTVNQQYYAVERDCLKTWQKRLDAAYGE